MAVFGQGADCRPACAVHRSGDTAGKPLLGHGLGLRRVASVVRGDTFEGDLSRAGYAARCSRIGRASANVRSATGDAEPGDLVVDRRPALSLIAGPLATQLHLSTRRLYGAADQSRRGQSPIDHLRCRPGAFRGNSARYRLRQRGERRAVSQPHRADSRGEDAPAVARWARCRQSDAQPSTWAKSTSVR